MSRDRDDEQETSAGGGDALELEGLLAGLAAPDLGSARVAATRQAGHRALRARVLAPTPGLAVRRVVVVAVVVVHLGWAVSAVWQVL